MSMFPRKEVLVLSVVLGIVELKKSHDLDDSENVNVKCYIAFMKSILDHANYSESCASYSEIKLV